MLIAMEIINKERHMKILKLASRLPAAALALLPGVVSAQAPGELVFTPLVGLYAPATEIAKASVAGGGLAVTGTLKHQNAVAYGGTISYWLTDRAAIEGSAVYSPSHLKGSVTMNEGGLPVTAALSDKAYMWLGTVKVMMQLLPPESGFNMRLGVGPAVITRAGTAYKGDEDGKPTGLTNVGGAVSLCTRIPVTSKVGLRLRAEDYIYRSKVGWDATIPSDSYTFGIRTNNDFVFSAGLQFFLNR
jgi:outer membrane protein W